MPRSFVKSRRGATPLNVDRLVRMERINKIPAGQFSGFVREMAKKSSKERPTDDEAFEAARQLTIGFQPGRQAGMAALTGAASPMFGMSSRGVQKFVDTPGNLRKRLAAAGTAAIRGTATAPQTKGKWLGDAAQGAMFGGVLGSARRGIELDSANRTLNLYRKQNPVVEQV